MSASPPDRGSPYPFAFAAIGLWATVATAFELALADLPPLVVLAVAATIAALALVGIAARQGKLGLLLRQTPRELGRSALLGALNPFAYYLVLLHAYDRLPAQQAQPLNYTWPIVLSLLAAPVLGQRLRLRTLPAALLGLAGVATISTRGEWSALAIDDPLGVSLAVGSSLIWAAYWLASLRDRRDEVVRLTLAFAFGALFAWIALALARPPMSAPPGAWAAAIYVGLFEMGLTFALWLRALALAASASQVGILVFITPFLSLIPIHFILGEPILPATLGGLGLIVAGVLVESWDDVRGLLRRRRASVGHGQHVS